MIDANVIDGKSSIELEQDEKWTNIQIDSQVLSTFMACHRLADYVFNRNLISIGGVSKSIEKGQLAHKGLHAYWESRIKGESYQQASIDGLEAAKKYAPELKNIDSDNVLECYQNLVEYFRFIQNLTWTPIATEKHFKFIGYEDPNLRLRIILTGRIDLIMRSMDGRIIPIDNKSEAERWFYTQQSNQFKIYALACKSNILGVQRFGFQKSLKPEDKFKMELIPFDPDILEEWRTETLPYWIKQLIMCKENDYWPQNTTNCVHGHFACQFSDKYNGGICNVSRSVREQKISRYFKIGEPWEPSEF